MPVPRMLEVQWHAVGIGAAKVTAAFLRLLDAVRIREAEALPVVLVPEQHLIAFVRLDVVNDHSRRNDAACIAHHAQRMLGKEAEASASPANPVTA